MHIEEIIANGGPWKKARIIGDCLLLHGDCKEIIPMLPSVDHIMCDGPYEEEAHTPVFRTQKSVKEGVRVGVGFDAMTEDLRKALIQFAIDKCQGWALYFSQVEAVGTYRDMIERLGGKYKRTCAFSKPDCAPQFNGEMPAQGFEAIVLQWCGKGRSKWNSGGKRGVYTHLVNGKSREGTHPTEKPLSLMRELINDFTSPGELIVDPTCGSGSTLVACAQLGRKGIGVELERKYFDIACYRVEDAYRQGTLFTAPTPMVQSKLDFSL